MEELKPVLCVVAGPNGAGKTSTTIQLLHNEWTDDCVYINPDDIAQNMFGDWNSEESVRKAARAATDIRNRCLEEKRNFVFETVFSSDEKLEFLMKAHDEGFFIRLFYICTESPEINVSRVTRRYLEGGHEVPISKIITRYYKSLANAGKAIRFVDRAYVYDNSIENRPPRLLFRTVNGSLFKRYSNATPLWALPILEMLE